MKIFINDPLKPVRLDRDWEFTVTTYPDDWIEVEGVVWTQ